MESVAENEPEMLDVTKSVGTTCADKLVGGMYDRV